MQRVFRAATRVAAPVRFTARPLAMLKTIPSDKEQQAGRRREEIEAEAAGTVCKSQLKKNIGGTEMS